MTGEVRCLKESKEHSIEIIMLGDGLSGKTTLIKAFAMEIALDEYHLHLNQPLNDDTTPDQDDIMSKLLQDQVFLDQLRLENPGLHEYLFKDIRTGTMGMETINFRWKCGPKEIIQLSGYDLGGQNIYDHLRRILAGLATPKTRMITVFDLSRRLSCENSLKQIQNQLKLFKKSQFTENSFIFVFNKIDLYDLLKSEQFREAFVECVRDKFTTLLETGLELYIPTILDPSEHITIRMPRDSIIGFEYLEAIFFDVFRSQFISRYQGVLTPENARALSRELAFHLLKNYHETVQLTSPNDDSAAPLERLKQILFSERPLAFQHVHEIVLNAEKKHLKEKDLFNLLRMKYEGCEIDLKHVTAESIKNILDRAVNVEPVIKRVQQFNSKAMFKTNALKQQGIRQVLNHLIETSIQPKKERRLKTLRRLSP